MTSAIPNRVISKAVLWPADSAVYRCMPWSDIPADHLIWRRTEAAVNAALSEP